jgi:hypothetical protein
MSRPEKTQCEHCQGKGWIWTFPVSDEYPTRIPCLVCENCGQATGITIGGWCPACNEFRTAEEVPA